MNIMTTGEGKIMEDKLCLVTGASRGIGYHIALGLAGMGAYVVLVGHNHKRGENASQRINAYTAKNSTDFMLADLSSQEQIRRFAEKFEGKHDHLDVLVNNAGGFFLRREESMDRMEMTFALNHMNYFSLTMSLLKHLLPSGSARIVNVSSEAHRGESMDFDDLQFENGYNAMRAYGQSKLANLLFTYELSRRLMDTDVTVNAVHPGFVSTHLGKQDSLVRVVMNILHFLFAKSAKEGAQTPVYLASSPRVEDVTGRYFIDMQAVRSSSASYHVEAAKRLWNISEELSGLDTSKAGLSETHSDIEVSEQELAKG